jgi:A/G-specific adenine glycosylase
LAIKDCQFFGTLQQLQKSRPLHDQTMNMNRSIGQKLIRWYPGHRRDLPWRDTKDPYTIWVSEIILQQTRVGQGLQFFHRFMERFPDIQTLAEAETDEIMKIWQGLGYYSRARNMHEAARHVHQHLGGELPRTYSGLLRIKGIGPYTAAAIASFAFDEEVPVVDGNVIRFLSRLYGIYSSDKKSFTGKARTIMDTGKPGLFNQAVMEFGALQCTPMKPLCKKCPFQNDCYAFRHHAINELPVKKSRPVMKTRHFHYFIIRNHDKLIMKKRDGTDIWKGLYDFPLIETEKPVSLKKLITGREWLKLFGSPGPEISDHTDIHKHILSHQVILARFYLVHTVPPGHFADQNFIEVEYEKIGNLPVPKLIERFLEKTDW